MNRTLYFLNSIVFFLTLASYTSGLYLSGKTIKDQKIQLADLAEGHIVETNELASHKPILRLTSQNYFSGGWLKFEFPQDLSNLYKESKKLFMITFKLADAKTVLGKAIPNQSVLLPKSDVYKTNIRIFIKTSDGKYSEAYLPLNTNEDHKKEWCKLGIPLRALSGFEFTNQKITELFIATQFSSTIYIQSIEFDQDIAPISAKIIALRTNFAFGDEGVFSAIAFGGANILDYSWGFDDNVSFQADAMGQQIKRRFFKPGKFRITLMVQDRFKIKKPSVQSIWVTVNP